MQHAHTSIQNRPGPSACRGQDDRLLVRRRQVPAQGQHRQPGARRPGPVVPQPPVRRQQERDHPLGEDGRRARLRGPEAEEAVGKATEADGPAAGADQGGARPGRPKELWLPGMGRAQSLRLYQGDLLGESRDTPMPAAVPQPGVLPGPPSGLPLKGRGERGGARGV